MPLFGTFSSASSRALGLRNGSPPLPPTISAPTDNQSLTGSGNTTNRINTTVSFTSTVTSFTIDRFEFKVDQLDGSDNPVVAGTYQTAASAGATSFLISNLLTSTKYGLYMRTVDIAGQVSEPTSIIRFTTAAEVAPTAPTPSLSSAALSVTIAYAAGTAGTYPIGTREFSLCPTTGGTTTYVPFTETVTRTTRTDGGAALLPNTQYTVSFRYTASSPTTLPGSTGSSDIYTSEETAPSAPGATLTKTGTTTATVSRGTSTQGTYPISNYQFRVYQGTTPSGTWIAMPNTTAAVTGLAVDTGHRAQVKAVAATSGTETISTSATATTDPNNPGTPTIAFSGMTPSSTGTAVMTISKAYPAESVVVNVSGGGASANYDSQVDTSNFVDNGTYWTFTVQYQSYNTTYTYKAYTKNRIGGQSSFSNTITWNTPKKNQYWNSGYDNPDPTFFTTTATCTSEFRIGFGDVPASDDSVGYIRVTSASVSGIQSFEAYDIPTTANTGFLYWYIPNGGYTNNLTQTGFSPNWGTGSYSTRSITGLSIGGNSLDNLVWEVQTTLGSRTAGCAVNFSISGSSYNVYKMKNFILEGVQTTAGSGTGF